MYVYLSCYKLELLKYRNLAKTLFYFIFLLLFRHEVVACMELSVLLSVLLC